MLGLAALSEERLLVAGAAAVAERTGTQAHKYLVGEGGALGWVRLGDTEALTPVLELSIGPGGGCATWRPLPATGQPSPSCSQSHWTQSRSSVCNRREA